MMRYNEHVRKGRLGIHAAIVMQYGSSHWVIGKGTWMTGTNQGMDLECRTTIH